MNFTDLNFSIDQQGSFIHLPLDIELMKYKLHFFYNIFTVLVFISTCLYMIQFIKKQEELNIIEFFFITLITILSLFAYIFSEEMYILLIVLIGVVVSFVIKISKLILELPQIKKL